MSESGKFQAWHSLDCGWCDKKATGNALYDDGNWFPSCGKHGDRYEPFQDSRPMPFRATIRDRRPDGTWLVRYFDTPRLTLELPVKVTRHVFRWSADLYARAWLRGWWG